MAVLQGQSVETGEDGEGTIVCGSCGEGFGSKQDLNGHLQVLVR